MSNTGDIVVVGGGAAGIAAAVSAARSGRQTWLLDQRPAAGGTGGFSGLTTLCGLFDGEGKFLVDGFAREFAEAVTENEPLRMGKVWVLLYARKNSANSRRDCLREHPRCGRVGTRRWPR